MSTKGRPEGEFAPKRVGAEGSPVIAPVYTPEFVERGYNNRAAVPDHAKWFVRYAELSAAARDALQPVQDLRYGDGPQETLDLFVPPVPSRGTLVFVHGGYWRALDKADFLFVATSFVDAGYAVAALNYDLCPAVSIAAIVEECRRAVGWIVREGARHGANASRIVVSGHSAGGHLAAMLLATPASAWGLARHPVVGRGVVLGRARPAPARAVLVQRRLQARRCGGRAPIADAPQTRDRRADRRCRGGGRDERVRAPGAPPVGRVAREPSTGRRWPDVDPAIGTTSAWSRTTRTPGAR